MNYKVEFKKTFIQDYNEILKNSSANSLKKFATKFSLKIKQIIRFPLSCPLLNDPHYENSGIRWTPLLDQFIVIYLFEKEKISFLRILQAKTNWINRLFDPNPLAF